MTCRERFLVNRNRPLEEQLRLFETALIPVERGEIVIPARKVRMIAWQRLLANRNRPF